MQPSSVMTVRPPDTTWPVTRISPESAKIGDKLGGGFVRRAGFADRERRLGGKRHDGVEHHHDPAAVNRIRQVRAVCI